MAKTRLRFSLRQVFVFVAAAGVLASAAAGLRGYGITVGKPDAWRQYYRGTAYEGQPVEDAIALTHPAEVERLGRYVQLEYGATGFFGLTAVAKDGRLVFARAWECTQSYTYFDDLPEADWETIATLRAEASKRRGRWIALTCVPLEQRPVTVPRSGCSPSSACRGQLHLAPAYGDATGGSRTW